MLELRLASGFARNARLAPDRPAVRVAKQTLTYGELDATARRWATALIAGAPRPLERVGIFAYRSATAYAGVLASLYAGAAFVPLNRTFPAARTATMIERADLDAIIVDDSSLPQLAAIIAQLSRVPRILLPTAAASAAPWGAAEVVDRTALATAAQLGELATVSADAPAYLLFTSGSTGHPKGVPITHRNALHFLAANQRRYRLTPEDRVTQMFDQTFDLSIFDLFMAWSAGACVCVPQPLEMLAPVRFIREHAITVWFSVPSIVALLRKKQQLAPGCLPTLRYSLFCGEALPRTLAESWQAAAPGSVLENLYGPTELTIACSAYRWDPLRSPAECVNDVVPIGTLYDGLHGLVLDDALRPVPDGESGELCVAGPQTFPGYFRDARATAENCFVRGGQRYYRTGDRVRRTAGAFVYLGRIDSQVKIRGYRIELGEVEAALNVNPGVVMSATIAWPIADGVAEGLQAFVVGNVDGSGLRARLATALPPYMVPTAIHVLDAMPLNANGKIDRRALVAQLENFDDELPTQRLAG